MQLEDQGIICDTAARPVTERVAFFSGIFVLNSGSVLCLFHLGAAKHAVHSTLRLCRSRDQGRTWSEVPFRFETTLGGVPGSFGSGQIVEVEPDRLLMIATWYDRSDPKQPLFDPVTEGLLPSKQLKAFSTDDGDTWSAWEEISLGGLKGCSSTGPILRWSDGTIAYPFESLKELHDSTPAVPGAWCVLSSDQGRSFGVPHLIARDPQNRIYYWDQRLCAGRTPGEFVALFWTHDVEQKRDLNVHLSDGSIGELGEKGAPVRETKIPGQIAAPLWLDDGRLLAFVVDRERPGTLTLWMSHDRGATWPEQLTVYIHEERARLTQGATHIDYVEYWNDMNKWTFGHPAIRSIGDDVVLLSYYAGTPANLSIHWARVNLRGSGGES